MWIVLFKCLADQPHIYKLGISFYYVCKWNPFKLTQHFTHRMVITESSIYCCSLVRTLFSSALVLKQFICCYHMFLYWSVFKGTIWTIASGRMCLWAMTPRPLLVPVYTWQPDNCRWVPVMTKLGRMELTCLLFSGFVLKWEIFQKFTPLTIIAQWCLEALNRHSCEQ